MNKDPDKIETLGFAFGNGYGWTPDRSLAEFETRELEEEIRRRKHPKPSVDVDRLKHTDNWSVVLRECQDYIEALDQERGGLGNIENGIVEAAMEAVYGPKVWDWINEKL